MDTSMRHFHGCSSIDEYDIGKQLGSGTFGVIFQATCRKTNRVVALKRIIEQMNDKKGTEKDLGFPITSLREIKLLKTLKHPNVVRLMEMAVQREKALKQKKKAVIYMVMPYMHHDLSGLLGNSQVHLSEAQIKCFMLQILEGMRYLHTNHILHRDVKAANLLINKNGVLQIADFGLARYFDEHPPAKGTGPGDGHRDYTALVVTRWYRPPELLLNLRKYTTAIDMWGVGCIFGEMFKRQPILTGKSDLDQAHKIWDLMGSPTDNNMPGWKSLPGHEGVSVWEPRPGTLKETFRELSADALSLLHALLRLDWRKRLTAVDAIDHGYFRKHPKPSRPEDLPTHYADSHEQEFGQRRGQAKVAPPPAPAGGTVGMGPEGETGPHGQPNSREGPERYRGAHGGDPGGWARDRDRDRYYDRNEGRGPPPYRGGFNDAPPPRGGGAPPPYDNNRRGGNSNTQRNPAPMSSRDRPDSLPARPPPPASGMPGARAAAESNVNHGGAGGNRGNRGGNFRDKDTYIPSYSGGNGPPMRGDRDRERERDRDDRDRDRDRDWERSRDRRYYRNKDRERDDTTGSFGLHGGYDDHGRVNGDGDARGRGLSHQRRRSRSPGPPRDRDREMDWRR